METPPVSRSKSASKPSAISSCRRSGFVGGDGQQHRLAARGLDLRGQGVRIRIANLVEREGYVDVYQLIAGGKHGDTRLRIHQQA